MAKKERLEDLGKICELLTNLLDMDVFCSNDLSKHNEDWYPAGKDKWKNDREGLIEHMDDKLDDCRRTLSCIKEKIEDIWVISRGEDE